MTQVMSLKSVSVQAGDCKFENERNRNVELERGELSSHLDCFTAH